MEAHEELLAWAIEKGVKINAIEPKRIPGRGIGIVATRAIKPEEIILDIPTSCIRSIDTVHKPIIRHLPKAISIHGLLAADLALDASSKYAIWNAVCPTPEDFAGMPLVWPQGLRALLPPSARDLLLKQEAKLKLDWAAVSAAFPEQLDEARYRYAWMLVNTRTFYYVNNKLKKRSKDDHMCLQPVADLFNHTDIGGCNVAFDDEGFSIKATCAYAQGDEVKICYGRHSGDFLLVEYGFAMDENRWDEILLDEVLLSRLSERQKERLEEVGFLGKYILDREMVCHRTQVAARLLCCGVREWKRFVDGIDDGERSQHNVDRLVLELLKEQRNIAEKRISEAQSLDVGEPQQKETLIKRWKQIQDLVDMNIVRLMVCLEE
ncbi:Ribosomal lysine N-methyltransferase set11 [Daldinia childiae]|uniref:Ribosomal lysine N-methyltransferase set11 n=1 Tax=Daldinia childiae TaxID=326645 RepID=UPI00144571E8|nr:Ribosomal lysine N-methyltransferase set11 [Daldinia childiae]KAF3069048.1 Ribosomal lysine N-methyltransferase set11 [Daldinia childiae]